MMSERDEPIVYIYNVEENEYVRVEERLTKWCTDEMRGCIRDVLGSVEASKMLVGMAPEGAINVVKWNEDLNTHCVFKLSRVYLLSVVEHVVKFARSSEDEVHVPMNFHVIRLKGEVSAEHQSMIEYYEAIRARVKGGKVVWN